MNVRKQNMFRWYSINVYMKWSIEENHIAVIAQCSCYKLLTEIFNFNILKSLKLTKQFIYQTANRYGGLLSVDIIGEHRCNMETLEAVLTKAAALMFIEVVPVTNGWMVNDLQNCVKANYIASNSFKDSYM